MSAVSRSPLAQWDWRSALFIVRTRAVWVWIVLQYNPHQQPGFSSPYEERSLLDLLVHLGN